MLAAKSLSIDNAEFQEMDREFCTRKLSNFIKRAWPIVEPSIEYKSGWAIDAMCEHLEAVTRNELIRLLINVPPGMMKSLLVNVFWPCWEWGPMGLSHYRYINAAHEEGLAIRDVRKARMIIESDWFQSLWPTPFARDQNEKRYFENENRGFRQACAAKSLTGKRGQRLLYDDPHSIEGALSDKDRPTTIRVFRETATTRMIDTMSAIVVVMQRIHTGDVSGVIIEDMLDEYEHLCLPMEFEPDRRCTTSLGFVDPRKEEGELLFPERFPRADVNRDKKAMGALAIAGQLQQRPAPRSGGFFEWQNIDIVKAIPAGMTEFVRYWDKAGTEDGGCYTAGVLMGKHAGVYYVIDVQRERFRPSKREKLIRQTAELDEELLKELTGKEQKVRYFVEQEPGSAGKESTEGTIQRMAGYIIKGDRPTGDKETRAEPYSAQVEGGNVKALKGKWTKDFIDEHQNYPVGYKDQIDAASGAFNKLAKKKAKGPGAR